MGEYADEAVDRLFDYEYIRFAKFKPLIWNYIPKGVKRHMMIRGKAKWAKVIGEPVWGFENTFKEWTTDVEIDDETQERLEAEGLGDKVKVKNGEKFVKFSRKEFKSNGEPNKPIRIVDAKGQPWDGSKIGNGSVVNVNFAINEYKKGKFSMNILALQVWEHVPYNDGGFPVKEDSDGGSWAEDAE